MFKNILERGKLKKSVLAIIIVIIILFGGFYLYKAINPTEYIADDIVKVDPISDDLMIYFENQDLIEHIDKNLSEYTQKRFEDSLISYKELQSDKNNVYQGYMGEATTYMQLGDYKTSLVKLKAMEERYPEDELVSMNMGDLYIKMHQYLDAAHAMHAAAQKKPSEILVQLRLAELYEKYSSVPSKAEDIYQQALTDTNSHIDIKKAYADFLENIKKDYVTAQYIWNDILSNEKNPKLRAAIEEKISDINKKANK